MRPLHLLQLLLAASSVSANRYGQPVGEDTALYHHDGNFQPDFLLRVTYENHIVACQQRMSVLINGTSPGPPLRLPPGKTSWVRVCNDMDQYNTTMHWHGLSQRTAPFSDGSPVSQWPIAPQRCFDYEVHPEEDDAGSYFYHSHIGFQAASATGPLIIEDRAAPLYKYDEELIVMIQDYFNKTDSVIEQGLAANPLVWSGETNAVLLNGIGVATGMKAGDGDCKLPVWEVKPDKTYRIRFIGATALSLVSLGIESHSNMTIISADGHYTKPYQVDHLQVGAGQRFEVLFETKTSTQLGSKTDYIIQFETKDRPAVYSGFGVLRYAPSTAQISTAPSTKPLALTNATYDWLEYALQPFAPNKFPTAAEVTRRIYISNVQLAKGATIWQLGGLNWTDTTPPNDPPYLVDIYEKGPSAMPNYTAALENNGWDPSTLTWPAKLGEVLEIIWYNTGSLVGSPPNGGVDFHPFHAHGGHYYDIGSGNGTYDPVANEEKLKNYQPVLRDTTILYRYGAKTTAGAVAGWRGWRLRVEDAGVWMMHCHTLQHMAMGMQSVWVMGDYEDIVKIPHPGAQGYLEYGGTAYGGDGYSPTVYHNWNK